MSSARRVLIADDEPPARDRLRRLLSTRSAYEVVAECEDGIETAQAMAALQPDIALLDIRMPELDGLSLVHAVPGHVRLPVVVFVTAFDEYAVRAFDAGALDYVLKPVTEERLDRALARAEERLDLRSAGMQPALIALFDSIRLERERPARLAVRDAKGVYFVRPEEIDWIDARRNYVRLHSSGRAHLVRGTVSGMAGRLDPARFLRVHRSAIVNLDRIARIEPYAHGEFVIHLRGGEKVRSSRAYGDAVRRLLV